MRIVSAALVALSICPFKKNGRRSLDFAYSQHQARFDARTCEICAVKALLKTMKVELYARSLDIATLVKICHNRSNELNFATIFNREIDIPTFALMLQVNLAQRWCLTKQLRKSENTLQ